MSEPPDYLDEIGVKTSTLESREDVVLVLRDEVWCSFPAIESATLRAHVNNAMDVCFANLSVRTELAGIEISRRQLLELCFRIVSGTLSRRWGTSRQLGALTIRDSDLQSESTLVECWVFCKQSWPADYATRVAALMGMSLHQFRNYQRDNRERLEADEPYLFDLPLGDPEPNRE